MTYGARRQPIHQTQFSENLAVKSWVLLRLTFDSALNAVSRNSRIFEIPDPSIPLRRDSPPRGNQVHPILPVGLGVPPSGGMALGENSLSVQIDDLYKNRPILVPGLQVHGPVV